MRRAAASSDEQGGGGTRSTRRRRSSQLHGLSQHIVILTNNLPFTQWATAVAEDQAHSASKDFSLIRFAVER
jgi:hypothetical protein